MAYLSMGEVHRRTTDYLNRFSDAVSDQDACSLKQLLRVSSVSPSFADALNLFQDTNRLFKQSERYAQIGEITAPLFRSFQSYRIGNMVDTYAAFEKAANAFLQEFRNWESGWALEALYLIAYEIRALAERADRELTSIGKSQEKLKGADSFLMKVFGVLAVMPQYINVVQALRSGDLRLLQSALQEYEDQFLRSGAYLVLEKLELQVYQRLLMKIYIIQRQNDPSKAHKMKLEVINRVLKWQEIEMDLDEVECIVAILIYKNIVKGYFAHKSKAMVLSKQDPFPNLNGKPVT